MNAADMLMIVRTLQRFSPLENLDRLVREHTADRSGHCPLCRTVGCTLYTAAMSARYAGGKVSPMKPTVPVGPHLQ